MTVALDAFTTDGRVVLTFPESAMQADAREEFIAFAKAEWMARQSRLTESEAKTLADEIDAGWWARNRERILETIGGA